MSYATPAYWQAQANACKQYADEGACLSRIARRAPGGVTIVPGFSGMDYFQARANECMGFANKGACLARISRQVPVTISPGFSGVGRGIFAGMSGLGQSTAQDIASGAQLIAGLFSNPEATLRVQGPRIVTALDSYIVGPVVQAAVERSTPYILRYLTPPLVTMYVMTALSTWFSYEVLVQSRRGALKSNRGRKTRRARRRR